jgi:hypothetical protein
VASVAVAVLALAASAGAASAPPVPAGHYAGNAGGHGRISFLVARGGRRIASYSATGRLHCNRRPFRTGRYRWRIGPEPHGREPVIRIHADGSFAITVHTHQPLREAGGGHVETVRGAYTLTGRFAPRRHSAGGTLRAVLTGAGGLRCEGGTHRWSARRAR